LDLGCGNGWFSNQIACISQTQIIAVDVNDDELKQAARVFQKPNLKFVYADIFSQESDDLQTFDIITVNSCIQYFDNLENILRQLKSKLSSAGELHIIDSPFYQQSDIASAKERTLAYYQSLGFPEMAEHYFHHTLTNVGAYEIMYKPNRSALNKLFRRIDTPFMWLKFDK
jgi:ubiquinone/menaquinone biosynthesis C-methylase UbiE